MPQPVCPGRKLVCVLPLSGSSRLCVGVLLKTTGRVIRVLGIAHLPLRAVFGRPSGFVLPDSGLKVVLVALVGPYFFVLKNKHFVILYFVILCLKICGNSKHAV